MKDGFIVLEGVLSEAGQFDLVRSVQSRHAEENIRSAEVQASGGLRIEAALLNANCDVLTKSSSAVHFPAGCEGLGISKGAGLIRIAIASHPDAHVIRLTYNGATVFSDGVGESAPQVSVRSIKATAKAAKIVLHQTDKPTVLTAWAVLADGKRLRPPLTIKETTLVVDLTPLAGLDAAELVVEATAGHRTAEIFCGNVKLPSTQVNAIIVEPRDGTEIPFGRRISLIATLSDQNGRKIDWCEKSYMWRINGKTLSKVSRQMAALKLDAPGKHQIEVIATGQTNGKPKTLARVTVVVQELTMAQEEYVDLIAQRAATAVP